MLSVGHIISLIITLSFIFILGWISASRVKNSSDFMVGGHRAGSFTVAGILTGTLIGGVATIGASQLGFLYGLSAFWFTIVLGIAVLILGTLAGPLKRAPYNTVSELLGTSYGKAMVSWSSLFVIFGMSINVGSNLLAARSLLKTITPFSAAEGTVFAGLLMVIYIVLGGIWSGSWIGLFKTFLIYTCIAVSIGFVFFAQGGVPGLVKIVQASGGLNFFGRGVEKEIAAAISVIVGVLSTQTYLQAIFSGKDVATSRRGAFLAGGLIIPVGLMGYFVGLFMRFHHPEIDSSQALPLFILNYLPPWVGGVMFGGLLLSVIGGGAGLALGISTVISNDLYLRLLNPRATEWQKLWVNRVTIVLIIGVAVFILLGGTNILMNDLTYLSMGLRGAAIFLPLLVALFFKDKFPNWVGYGLLFSGAGSVILWFIFGTRAIDPIYPALVANCIVLAIGKVTGRESTKRNRRDYGSE